MLFFAFSYELASSYTLGDQLSYRRLYEALGNANFWEVSSVSSKYIINSMDWVSYYIIWIPAKLGVNKDIFIASSNLFLVFCLYHYLKKKQFNYFYIFLFSFNYYIIVLMTSAERLKFSIILLLLAAIASNKFLKTFLSIASIFAHLQTLIVYLSLYVGFFIKKFIKILKTQSISKVDLISFAILSLLALIIILSKFENIFIKAMIYTNFADLSDLIKITIITVIGMIVVRDKALYAFTMLPIITGVILMGGDRLNMIAFIILIYQSANENRQNHFLIGFLLLYFFIKSPPFIYRVFVYGNGF